MAYEFSPEEQKVSAGIVEIAMLDSARANHRVWVSNEPVQLLTIRPAPEGT